MEKEQFSFINEGNGIEGIVSKNITLDKETSAKPKIAIKDKKTHMVWDPIFECFIEKDESGNILEKGTVKLK